MNKIKKIFIIVLMACFVVPCAMALSACDLIPDLSIPEGVTVTAVAPEPSGGSNAGSLIVQITVKNDSAKEYVFTAGAISVSAPIPGGTHSLGVQNPGNLTVPAGETKSVSVTVTYNALISSPITVKYGEKTIS